MSQRRIHRDNQEGVGGVTQINSDPSRAREVPGRELVRPRLAHFTGAANGVANTPAPTAVFA